MPWLMTAHVRRYHRHHRSSGHLWQGRFKAFPIKHDDHLLTVLRYAERVRPSKARMPSQAARFQRANRSMNPVPRACRSACGSLPWAALPGTFGAKYGIRNLGRRSRRSLAGACEYCTGYFDNCKTAACKRSLRALQGTVGKIIDEQIHVEAGGIGVAVNHAKLGFLQMPKAGSFVREAAAAILELGELIFGIELRRFPEADRFIPVGAGQQSAVGAESGPRIEAGIPVALRRAAERQGFVAGFDIPQLHLVSADRRQTPAVRAEHEVADQVGRRQGVQFLGIAGQERGDVPDFHAAVFHPR